MGAWKGSAFKQRRLLVEPLEDRQLLAAWIPQGPAPSMHGQVENIRPNDEVVGAMHTVLAHPTDADILYAGGVNGGVWRTDNASASSPHWQPLTDDLPSLSISALAMDPADPNRLLAGTGRYSSFAAGGDLAGLALTEDGGLTWQVMDDPLLVDRNISGVAIAGDLMLAGAGGGFFSGFDRDPEGGLFRSTDGGQTWTSIEVVPRDTNFPEIPISFKVLDLVGDPTDFNRYYASVQGVGIFRSDDGGQFWTNISENSTGLDALIRATGNGNNNTEMAVGVLKDPVSGAIIGSRMYTGVIVVGNLQYIGYTDDLGITWTAMDLPGTLEGGTFVGINPEPEPGGQGAIHFSITADPNDPWTVYVGGDRQDGIGTPNSTFGNSIGAKDFSGRLFRGDTRIPSTGASPSPQWEHLTHSDHVVGVPGGGTRSSSAPHADSRDMTFDAAGNLIEVDDGGIYRRTSPQDNRGDWFSIIGDLQTTEFHDIAYDSNTNTIVGGTQDIGTLAQLAPGDKTWESFKLNDVLFRLNADGGDVAVDDSSAPGYSYRYSSSQSLGFFRRQRYDADNNLINQDFIDPPTDVARGTTIVPSFVTPIELNQVDQKRLVVGGLDAIYESHNRAGNFWAVPAGPRTSVDPLGPTRGIGFKQNAMVYGGWQDGVANPDVLYVGSADELLVRTGGGGDPLRLTRAPFPGGRIVDVVLDRDDWMTAFAMDQDRIYVTPDVGNHWSDITGNLQDVGASQLRSLAFIEAGDTDGIVVGTNTGAFITPTSDLGNWQELGADGPLPHAPVYDLDYDLADDVLVAGMLGRGAWMLEDARSEVLAAAGETGGGGGPPTPAPVGSVSGIKWDDVNGDGNYDPQDGEKGLPFYYIYVDLNEDGIPGVDEPGAITSLSGHYRISDIPVGTYTVREAKPSGTNQTYPPVGAHEVTIEAGVEVTDVNFGNQVTFGVKAEDDQFTVDEDSADNVFDVLDNDTVSGGGVLTIIDVSTPDAGGSARIATDGLTVLYTPKPQFFGTETFTYTVEDGLGSSDQATVTVDVLQINHPPIARDDTFDILQDSTDNLLDVLDNDSTAPDVGETLSIIEVGPTSAGGQVVIADGADHLLYTPAAGFNGTETFTYTIEDNNGGTDSATVTAEVQPLQDLVALRLETTDLAGNPISTVPQGEDFLLRVLVEDLRDAPDGTFAAYLDVTYDDALVSVAGNFTYGVEYPNAQSGSASVAGLLDEVGGTDGFTPLGGGEIFLFSVPLAADAVGQVTFASDPADLSPIHDVLLFGRSAAVADESIRYGTTSITVTSNVFAAVDDQVEVPEDSVASSLDVLANDTLGPAGGTLEIVDVGATSQGGSVAIVGGGTRLEYTPVGDFFGTETFTYTVTNGLGDNDQALVTVDVTPVNDDPIAVDDSFTVDADSTGNVLDVLDNDSIGPDAGETLVITDVGTTSHGGTVDIAQDSLTLLYAPAAGFTGTETFTYTIGDGNGGSDSALVTVDVVGPGALVRINLVTTDLAGTPISNVGVGQSFVLEAFVQDVRTADPEGVFAAYLDVIYNGDLASVSGTINPGADYPNAASGDTGTPGLIDEAGGTDGLSVPPGTETDPHLLFSVQFSADAVGDLTFSGEPADVSPAHDVLVFGSDDPVPPSQVEFIPVTMTIGGQPFTNSANPLDVNDDGSVSPIDALSVINDLNRYGSRELGNPNAAGIQAVASGAAETGTAPTKFVDVNGDGSVTPIDALLVINGLNRAADSRVQAAPASAAVAAVGPAETTGIIVPADPSTRSNSEIVTQVTAIVPVADATESTPPMAADIEVAIGGEAAGMDGNLAGQNASGSAGTQLDAALADIAADVASAWGDGRLDDGFLAS